MRKNITILLNSFRMVYNPDMRRPITKKDKKILDKYSNHIQTLMMSGTAGFSFLALSIGTAVGGILGAIVAFGILGEHHPLSLYIFLFSFLIGGALAVFFTMKIGTRSKRNKLFRVGITLLNGATCVNNIDDEEFTYTEDDLLDENGHPYKILFTELYSRPKKGDRFIVLVNGDVTFLMKAENEELASLIPEKAPQEVHPDSIVIAHQNELLKKTSVAPQAASAAQTVVTPTAQAQAVAPTVQAQTATTSSQIQSQIPSASAPTPLYQSQNEAYRIAASAYEKRQIETFYNHYPNTSRFRRSLAILGTGFFGFCFLTIIFFSCYGLFFDGTAYEDRYFPVAVPLIFLLTPVCIWVCIRVFKRSLYKKYGEIKAVKPVLLVRTNVNMIVPHTRDFVISEADINGNMVVNQYRAHPNYDCADSDHMKPGQTIFKYIFENGGIFFGSK